jgi:hypothetical protein
MFGSPMKNHIRRHVYQFLALAGALAIFLQVNSVALVTVLFSANEQQIAATQCEKATPHCNGQCFLKKQMKAAAEESGNATNTNESLRHLPSISGDYLQSDVSVAATQPPAEFVNRNLRERTIQGHIRSVFNPPRFAQA